MLINKSGRQPKAKDLHFIEHMHTEQSMKLTRNLRVQLNYSQSRRLKEFKDLSLKT